MMLNESCSRADELEGVWQLEMSVILQPIIELLQDPDMLKQFFASECGVTEVTAGQASVLQMALHSFTRNVDKMESAPESGASFCMGKDSMSLDFVECAFRFPVTPDVSVIHASCLPRMRVCCMQHVCACSRIQELTHLQTPRARVREFRS